MAFPAGGPTDSSFLEFGDPGLDTLFLGLEIPQLLRELGCDPGPIVRESGFELAFFDDPELPGAGEGFYYVVRADSVGVGTGTYDDPPGTMQFHSRDHDQGPAACTDLR